MATRTWTREEDDLMALHYPHETAQQVAKRLNRSIQAVYARARTLEIGKSDAFLASTKSGRLDGERGRATRFQPGQSGWNKGMKGLQIGGKATQFKKGQIPHNHLPIGTEVMATIGFLKVKVGEPNEWEWVHKRNWIAAHGPIPKGMVLAFKDGNRRNCAMENLELVSRRELMRRNTIQRYPESLRGAMQANGRLKKQLQRKTEEAHEEQNSGSA